MVSKQPSFDLLDSNAKEKSGREWSGPKPKMNKLGGAWHSIQVGDQQHMVASCHLLKRSYTRFQISVAAAANHDAQLERRAKFFNQFQTDRFAERILGGKRNAAHSERELSGAARPRLRQNSLSNGQPSFKRTSLFPTDRPNSTTLRSRLKQQYAPAVNALVAQKSLAMRTDNNLPAPLRFAKYTVQKERNLLNDGVIQGKFRFLKKQQRAAT